MSLYVSEITCEAGTYVEREKEEEKGRMKEGRTEKLNRMKERLKQDASIGFCFLFK